MGGDPAGVAGCNSSLFPTLLCRRLSHYRMDYSRFTGLAGELRVAVLKERMATATLEEVMAMSRFCTEWHAEIRKMLPGWLSKHAAGSRIGEFEGTQEQMEFVREHMEGTCNLVIK
jgi:hypothetical protein